LFRTDYFRVYTNPDVIGVELGGALKNVIALAAGVSDGLGFGHNARAALINRGLVEMARLGAAKGAQAETFAGLAGMGDLVLTCTGDLSRNRSVGIELGRGRKLGEILGGMRMVAEGVKTTLSAYQLARELGVVMPITEQMYQILYQEKDPRQAVNELMQRQQRSERSG
jgi:glycerol-3-phosphate dehydrogenase (NAD(P)+)